MDEIQAVVIDDQPARGASVPAGSLHMGHLGALVEVASGESILQGRLKEVTHGTETLSTVARTKLHIDLRLGGFAWPKVEPQAPVLIIEWPEVQ